MNSIQQLTIQFSDFFRWWGKTLASIIPNNLRNFFINQTDQPLFVRFTNFQVHFYSNYHNVETQLASFYLHQEGKKQCDTFFEINTNWKKAKKYLLLNDKQVLNKKLTLPLAAQKNLTQVIMYEVDRYTPFNIDNIFFNAKTIKSDNENKQISVDFTFIGKEKLNHYYNELKGWGLTLDGIFEDTQTKNCTKSNNFLPEELQTKESKIKKIVHHLSLACLLVLVFISVGMPVWLQNEKITLLNQEISTTKRKANEVDIIKTAIDDQLQEVNKITVLKQNSPPILNIIGQLTNLLPRKTYLKSFEYSNNKIQILGLSASASTLISVLEDSAYFKQTNFVSPITQDVESGGQDLFQLVTQMKESKNAK
jgi:general secretion pathway protein L